MRGHQDTGTSTRPKQPVSYEQCLLIVPQVFQHVYEHDRIKPPFAVHQFFERCRQHLNVSETESLDLPGHVGFGLQRNESTRGPSYPPSEVADAGADLEYRARDVRLECGKHPLLVSGGRPQQLQVEALVSRRAPLRHGRSPSPSLWSCVVRTRFLKPPNTARR